MVAGNADFDSPWHVAYVTSLGDDGSLSVSEMDWYDSEGMETIILDVKRLIEYILNTIVVKILIANRRYETRIPIIKKLLCK